MHVIRLATAFMPLGVVMTKLPIPRTADGEIDVLKLKMRDHVRVDYSAYAATPKEMAELVMLVVDIQRQMREQVVMGVAA